MVTPSQIVEKSGYGYTIVNNNGVSLVETCPEEDADGDGVFAWEDCDDSNGLVWDFGSGGSSTCPALSCDSILAAGHVQPEMTVYIGLIQMVLVRLRPIVI